MSRSGKVLNVDELEDAVNNMSLNKFTGNYLKDQERYYIAGNNGDPIVFNSGELNMPFPVKMSAKPENVSYTPKDKLELTFNTEDNGPLFNTLNETFKNKIIDWSIANQGELKILGVDFDDEESAREELEHAFRPPIYKKGDYQPNFTVRAEEFPKEGLKWSKMIKKQDGSYIKSITDVIENDEVKLFGRGTQTQSILMLNYVTFKENAIRLNLKLIKIQELSVSSGIQINYITAGDNESVSNIQILPPKKAGDQGGKKSYYNYNGGQTGIDFSTSEGLVPKDWPIENVDKNSGNPYYNICLPIQMSSGLHTFLNDIDNHIIDIMCKNSKEWTGKKLSKKLTQKYVKSLLKFSKEDQEKVKNGEDPQYDPLFVISLQKYDNNFTFTFFDENGNKLDPGTYPEYHQTHAGASYNFKVKFQHGWYGQKYSTKIVLTSVSVVKSSSNSSFTYNFDDDEATANNSDDNGSDNNEGDDDEDNNSEVNNSSDNDSSDDDNNSSDDDDEDD